MLDYRIKTLSAAIACSTCLMLPLYALAKDNDKDKAPPSHAAQPAHSSAPSGAGGAHGGGGNPGGGGGNQNFHPPGGGNQLTQHGPPVNTGSNHPGGNPQTSGGSHNLSGVQNTHGPANLTPHANTVGASNTHLTGTQHGPASGNSLVKPAGPLVHPAGPGNNAIAGHGPGGAGGGVGHGPGTAGGGVGHGPGAAGGGAALGHAGSQTQLSQLNASRSNMHGINGKPLPAGEMSSHPNGSYSLRTAHGNELGVRHDGSLATFSGHGESARFASNGHVAALHTAGMDIHNVHGARFITTQRPDHSLLVSTGRHGGYLERPYAFGGHAYLQRSYAWGGHFYNRYFYPYRYHGLLLAGAIAAYYYAPHFYGWAYDPWAAPVAYNWGWRSAPWYGYYNGYFAPSPSYVDGAAWLTDYSLSQNLSSAYDDAQGDGPQDDAGPAELGAVYSDGPAESYIAAPAATPITPELKAAITLEVRRQLAEEQAAAANPNAVSQAAQLQGALQAGNVFIVSSNLAANTPDQHNCVLTAGDTLQLQNPPGDSDSTAILRVASTKKGDCPANTNVQLTLQNLADMQNDLRMQIDSGLASLQENQGKNGLPAAPTDALTKPQPVVASNDAGNTSDVQALLDAQHKQADQAEQQVSQSALSGS